MLIRIPRDLKKTTAREKFRRKQLKLAQERQRQESAKEDNKKHRRPKKINRQTRTIIR